MTDALDAATVIARLGLMPHPEGGFYRETFRDPVTDASGRALSTAIHYLLAEGQASHWHRVDAVEIWHFHAGDALDLDLSADGIATERHVLGADLRAGQSPQVVVPRGVWQSARPRGRWTLVSCTVAPGFEFSGFDLAPPDWRPGVGWAPTSPP